MSVGLVYKVVYSLPEWSLMTRVSRNVTDSGELS